MIINIQRTAMLLVLLIAGWAAGSPLSAQTYVELLPDKTMANGTDVTSLSDEATGISFAFDKAKGTTPPRYYSGAIRNYINNTVTMSAPSGIAVSKIEFATTVNKTPATLTPSSGSVSYDETSQTFTWENPTLESEATFTVGKSQFRITSIRVYYSSSGDVKPKPKAPVFSHPDCEFYNAFKVVITDLNEPATTIRYTLDGTEPTETNGTVYTEPVEIAAGQSVVLKAVCINKNGVSAITTSVFTYKAKSLFKFTCNKPGGISQVNLNSTVLIDNSPYIAERGSWKGNYEMYVTDGAEVSLQIYMNTGYVLKGVTLNGEQKEISKYGELKFVMPSATEAIIMADVEFDPNSPSDPQPPTPVEKTYQLSVVSNPTGAASVSGTGKYKEGQSVYVSANAYPGYVFKSWTCDGVTIGTSRSFNYTMTASDAVLTANFVYNPSNPGDPEKPALKHPLTAVASPAGAATFSLSSSEVVSGQEYTVRAYPATGYKLKGWMLNGVGQEGTSTTFSGVMTDAGAQVVAVLTYDPASPGNPGANYYNPATGLAIIDDFVPGNLSAALQATVGINNYSNVNRMIVKGRMTTGDYRCLKGLTNAATIDLSRVGGVTTVPNYAFENMAVSTMMLPASTANLGYGVFRGCSNLTDIYIYAVEPPTCSNDSFDDSANSDYYSVYVPAESVELYATAAVWKNFTILPITNDAHVLQVNLPADGIDGRYKNNTVELVNINSGIRQKYVISDRMLYTFGGLRKDENYNVYMYSRAGLEIGRIENVLISNQDLEVTFTTLKKLYTVAAKVMSPDGDDLTAQTIVEWLKPLEDGTTEYMRKAVSLGEIPEGQKLVCRVTLDEKLGVVYSAPADTEFTVSGEENTCTMALQPLRTVKLMGTVTDDSGIAISDASVSVVQILNGKFQKSFTTKTDRRGQWTLTVLATENTILTFAAKECVDHIENIGEFIDGEEVYDIGKTVMKSIVGARVTYGFTFKAAGAEVPQDYYNDYRNVAVSVYNMTQDRELKNLSVQYPLVVVLDEAINVGDELRLTATSKTGAFSPVMRIVKIDENQRADVTFDIVGKGGIEASFEMTDNPAVTAMLYSGNGELLQKVAYTEAKTSFESLEDGDYTLVTMGQSDLMNSILRLSMFDEMGLTEGKDYVKNAVKVESGKITVVKNANIPAFDESLFYYTTPSTSFSSNKSSIVNGRYLTLCATIDFKGVYKSGINNVALVVDLPEACDFVEKSVIQGRNIVPYTLDGKRLTINLGNNYQSQIRFCVIPTASGLFNATASVMFSYDGRIVTQPIGSVLAKVKDIEIGVPSIIASQNFTVTGTARANSNIKVFEGESLLGSGKANAEGSWNVACELLDAYNLSTHNVYAEITTPDGNVMSTETKQVTYDMNAIQVSKVTMYHMNPELHQTFVSVFDFLNPKNAPTQWTVYYPKKQFTYTIEFTNNDPERISNVVLYVHTADGKYVPCNATYNEQKKLWYAEIDMGHSSDGYYPVNCSVDFDFVQTPMVDAEEFNNSMNAISISREELLQDNAELAELDKKIEELDGETDTGSLAELLRQSRILSGAGADMPASGIGDMTEEETMAYFDALKIEIDKTLSNDNISVLENAFTQNLNEVLNEIDGITASSCDGYTEEQLVGLGYTEIKRSGATSIYVLATETSYTIIDFCSNSCITVDLAKNTKLASILKASSSDDFVERMNDYLQSTQKYWDTLRDSFSRLAGLVEEVIMEVAEKKAANVLKLKQVDDALEWLDKQPYKNKPFWVKQMKDWRKLRNSLNSNIAQNGKILNWLTKHISTNGLRVGKLGGVFAAVDVGLVIVDACNSYTNITALYKSIPNPCEGDMAAANKLRNEIRNTGVAAGIYYTAQLASDVLQIASLFSGVAAIVPSGGTSLGLVAGSLGLAVANLVACKAYEKIYENRMNKHYHDAMALACLRDCGKPGNTPCPLPTDGNGGGNHGGSGNGGTHFSGSPNDNVRIDPSGYVYEAVPENRVEGVQATIYYKETKEDIYGDMHEDIVMWNAEDYAQKNPLFTDENGMYRWDVPQGLWQVKFEKDGYLTAYSEWLPVPPPQLEVNIGITQNKQPEVTEARAYEEGVEIQFDKYMDPATLTDANISVTAGGNKLAGEIQLVDAALADEYASPEDAEATRYASRIRFVPQQALATTTGEVRLTVSRNVRSYAGIPMTETYSQTLDVEKEVQKITADNIKIIYGAEKELTVYALPSEAAAGRTLHVANSSEMVASLETTDFTLDAEGKAVVKIKGDLPGRTQLSFTIDDVTAKGQCMVDVMTEIITAEAPTASRASGTAVYRGTKVELATDSKDATIYFTTDGTCPCDENGTRRKYTVPIVINDDMHIKAMTMVGNDEVSDVKEFSYVLKKSDMDFNMIEGWTWMSHSFADGMAIEELAADAAVERVKSQTKESLRDPQLGFVGTLSVLNASESYKVETSAAVPSLRFSGVSWNPATPIALNGGWNWLGYPAGQTMTLDEAFATSAVEKLDVIVGQDGFSQYDGEHWVGTLETLMPGKGYMYQSMSGKDVVYNTSIVSKAHAQHTQGIGSKLPLAVDKHKYPSVMPVIATVCNANGTSADNADYQLAAFCGSECRGVGRLAGGLLMMSVYGNTGDRITVHVTDYEGNNVLASDMLDFSENLLGNIDAPYAISLGNTNSIGTTAYDGNVRVTVVGKRLLILGVDAGDVSSVELFDVNGQKVKSDTHISESGIDVSSLPGGVYVAVVCSGGHYSYHKIALR